MTLSAISPMTNGNKPVDGGNLILDFTQAADLRLSDIHAEKFIRPFLGSAEAINGKQRFCLWINDKDVELALSIPAINGRINLVQQVRKESTKELTRRGANTPHAFQQLRQTGDEVIMIIPKVSSESRPYLPVGLLPMGTIISDLAFGFYDAPLWNMALIASRLHLIWIGTVCGKMKTDFRYSNTLGWNTFPVPFLTEQNKADLTACAENILLAREAHFPATIADLYDPEKMPDNLRAAHEHNDELLERIYIGRRFRNDTERLEKLFDLYTKMTAAEQAKPTTRPVTKSTRRSKA